MSARLRLLLLILLGACAAVVYWLARDRDGGVPPRAPGATATTRRWPTRALGVPAVEISAAIKEHTQASGRRVLSGAWGSEPGQFGQLTAHESNPEGPMSLLVDGAGNLLVLDQVNRRVQRFGPDGSHLSSLAIRSARAQDVVVDGQGRTLVLSRLGEPGVEIYGADGKVAGRLGIVGGLLSEGGAATGLFVDGDGVYVESEHDDLVRVADGSGKQASLSETLPGRPTRDGRLYVRAGIIDKEAGRVYVQAHDLARKLAWETPLNLGRPLLQILLLDSDLAGNVYLGVEVGREDLVSHQMSELATLVVRLSSAGRLSGVLTLPPSISATETFRPLAIGDDGTVYQMVLGPRGVTVTAFAFPT